MVDNPIQQSFQRILDGYLFAKTQPFAKHPLANHFRESVPEQLKECTNYGSQYLIEGSAGQGNWADIPWVGIFDSTITTSAQEGYYIVYLFNANMTGLYLSLNQGWTHFEETYPSLDLSRNAIEQLALVYRDLIGPRSSYPTMKISLSASGTLGKGYELGHICGKAYGKLQIPNDFQLIDDLDGLVDIYKELKSQIASKSFVRRRKGVRTKETMEENAKDATFQQEILDAPIISLPDGPIPPGIPNLEKGSVAWVRNPSIAKLRCEEAQYKCEVDPTHVTFISRATGKPYVEAHHLVPVSRQRDFVLGSLDVPENILILCPLCHRKFHHAQFEPQAELIEKFYLSRKEVLEKRGIQLSFETLKKYYFSIC